MSQQPRSLLDLPIEIIERIVEKCHEIDVEALTDDFRTIVKRENAAQTDERQPGEETGWETEEDDGDGDSMAEDADEDVDGDQHHHRSSHRKESHPSHELHEDTEGMDVCSDCGCYHPDDDDSHASSHGVLDELKAGPPPSTHQLALTNKFLRTLALPYIYYSVDFEGVENFKMRRFLEEIVPKYGQFVKDFWVRFTPNENSEFFHMTEEEMEDVDLYNEITRFDYALELLKALPNLETIDIDTTKFETRRIEDLFEEIARRGETLKGLHLTADVIEMRLTTGQLSSLLRPLTKLVHLELVGVDRQSSDSPSLRDTIAGLQDLRYLDMSDALCLQDDWADTDWKCKLRAIELDDCQNITGDGVEAFIKKFTDSLYHLSLHSVPYQSIGSLNNGRPFDFQELRALEADNFEFNFDFLNRFAQCPKLARIELGSIETANPRELSDLIERARSTANLEAGGFPALKEIMLSSDWPTAEEDASMEGLELVCFANNITLEIEPMDSDDEDDDDDPSFDGSDPENEYWDEGFTEDDEVISDEDDDDEDDEIDEID